MGCLEGLAKLMRIAKIAKFMKTVTVIRKTCDKVNEIYFKGFRDSPEKAMRIAKTAKFTRTAKFTIICTSTYRINKIYSKGHAADLFISTGISLC